MVSRLGVKAIRAVDYCRSYRSPRDVVAGARRAWDELDTETIVRGRKFGNHDVCELLRQKGSYVDLQHTGLTQAQANGDLDAFVEEYLQRRGVSY